MITTVAVAGYRSLRDVIVPVAPLTVVTGPNGSGKSNLYRALRLLGSIGRGEAIRALAREGGLASALWSGPEPGGTQGTVRRGPVALQLGVGTDTIGYLADLGLPSPQPDVPPSDRSMFGRDPEIKRELVFAGPVPRPAALLVERRNGAVRIRIDGSWTRVPQTLAPWESVVTDLADGSEAPELLGLRRELAGWRFYDQLRTDSRAPARRPQVGTRTPSLSSDGGDLPAAWQTAVEAGRNAALEAEVQRAFPGCRVDVESAGGLFRLRFHQPGLLRPLGVEELSDGTLRYLLLCAALLPTDPAPLLVLNEPEASLHHSLLGPLAEMIAGAGSRTQVIVVSHDGELVAALETAGASSVRLQRDPETRVEGQTVLTTPRWEWGHR